MKDGLVETTIHFNVKEFYELLKLMFEDPELKDSRNWTRKISDKKLPISLTVRCSRDAMDRYHKMVNQVKGAWKNAPLYFFAQETCTNMTEIYRVFMF